MNNSDPSGLVQCGESLSSGDCEKALNDSDAARENYKNAADTLNGAIVALESGNELTFEQEELVAGVEKYLGDGYSGTESLKTTS